MEHIVLRYKKNLLAHITIYFKKLSLQIAIYFNNLISLLQCIVDIKLVVLYNIYTKTLKRRKIS